MKIGDYIVLGVILLWLVLAFCWMHRQKKRGNCIGCSGCAGKNCKKCEKMTAMECKPCLVRMKNILYNSL